MDFGQIFENRKVHMDNFQNINYNGKRYSNQTDSGYDKYFRQKTFLRQIFSNPKLRAVVLIVLIVVIGILVALVAILFPLIKNIVDYILDNGISGLAGEAGKLLESILNGNK